MDGKYYPRYLPMFLNKSYNFTCLNQSNKTSWIKSISCWNSLWDEKDFHYGESIHDVFIKQRCPVTNCETTSDKNRLNKSSMYLFYIEATSTNNILSNLTVLPEWRNEHQLAYAICVWSWIWKNTLESNTMWLKTWTHFGPDRTHANKLVKLYFQEMTSWSQQTNSSRNNLSNAWRLVPGPIFKMDSHWNIET